MIPNYGYQISQNPREITMTRRQIIEADARRGRQAAATARACRRLTRRARASGTIAINAITGLAARAASVEEEQA